MQTATERYQLLCAKHERTFEEVVKQYTAKEISAIDAWNRLPCHVSVRYEFGSLNVTSPFQGNHARFLDGLYMDLVSQDRNVPFGGRPILSLEFDREHFLPHAGRRNAEAAEFSKLANEAAIEHKRNQKPKRTTSYTHEYDDERIANIIRKVLRDENVHFG